MTLESFWRALPLRVRRPLLFSGSGSAHLAGILAREANVPPGAPQTPPKLLADIALHLWELMPFSAQTAKAALLFMDGNAVMSDEAVSLCARCAEHAAPLRHLPVMEKLLAEGYYGELRDMLDKVARGPSGGFQDLHYARETAFRNNDPDWLQSLLALFPLSSGHDAWMRADIAFMREDWRDAASLYARAYAALRLPELLTRQGEAHARSGEAGNALDCWLAALALRPWQVNLLLRATDLMRNRAVSCALPSGKGEILFYTWNHGEDIDKALAAVAASETGDARIQVLDNGSTDNTSGIVNAWRERLGGDRLRVITLPTNVGAPAARNWLLATEESRAADWVVFLDDDALVPPQWLGSLGTALRTLERRSPGDASRCVIGCRVVDHAAPMAIQNVDLHLAATYDDEGNPHSPQHVQFVNSHQDAFDFGQYSYLRPATSVTGCCHLLTRGSVEAIGGFDLRFSPTQFDDVDRDLRAAAKGLPCIYQGHLRVEHIKRSGGGSRASAWARANADGNSQKLVRSWPDTALASVLRNDIELLEQDFAERLHTLAESAGD